MNQKILYSRHLPSDKAGKKNTKSNNSENLFQLGSSTVCNPIRRIKFNGPSHLRWQHFLLNSVDPQSVENLTLGNRMCQSSRSEGLVDKGMNDWFGQLKNHVRSTAQVVGNEPDWPTTRHEESPLVEHIVIIPNR